MQRIQINNVQSVSVVPDTNGQTETYFVFFQGGMRTPEYFIDVQNDWRGI